MMVKTTASPVTGLGSGAYNDTTSGMSIQVHGLKELQANIKRLGEELATKGIRQAVAAGAAIIKKQAILNAPEAEAAYNRYSYVKKSQRGKKGSVKKRLIRPGGLKRAIIVKGLKDKATPTSFTYIVTVKHGVKEQQKERDAYYWWWIENGTSKIPKNAYLRPAYETKKYEATTAVKNKLRAFIDKHGNRK